MSGMPWYKHYTNKRNDPRVRMLSLPSRGVYYSLSEVAGQCDAQGAFVISGVQLTNQQLAELINVSADEFKKAMKEMTKIGLISANGHGPYLVDFALEQTPQEERRKQWRARQDRRRDKNGDVTQNVTGDKKGDVTPIEERVKSQSLESENLLLLLSDADRKFAMQHPEWISDAIALAIKTGKPRATYAAGILKNWIKEGKNNATPKNSQRDNKRAKPAQPVQTAHSASDIAAAARAIARRNNGKQKPNV